jgi:hypothetical protein
MYFKYKILDKFEPNVNLQQLKKCATAVTTRHIFIRL